jgi:hypothetical protein
MGLKVFGVDVAKIVAQKVGPGLHAMTLIRKVPTTREPGNLAGGTQPTEVSYPCRGIEATLEQRFIDGDKVKITDVAILLLGDTIDGGNVEPRGGDRLTSDGKTRAVIRVLDRDPAKATWLVACVGP